MYREGLLFTIFDKSNVQSFKKENWGLQFEAFCKGSSKAYKISPIPNDFLDALASLGLMVETHSLTN